MDIGTIEVEGAETAYLDPAEVKVVERPDAAYAADMGRWTVLARGLTMEACPTREAAEAFVEDRARDVIALADIVCQTGVSRRVPGAEGPSPAWTHELRDIYGQTQALFRDEASGRAFVAAVHGSAEAWKDRLGIGAAPAP